MSKHIKFKCLREVKQILRKCSEISKIGYSGITTFVYAGKKEIHKYMQYEVFMTVYMGWVANQRKVPKWLPFINYKSESLNISCAYIPGTYGHIHTKYEVSV